MSVLSIHLFGGLRVTSAILSSDVKVPHSVQPLLAYLMVRRSCSHPRDVLAGVLWPDQSQGSARNCLNTALWRLRSILEPDRTLRGTYLVTTLAGDVAFNTDSDFFLDADVFEEQALQFLKLPVGITDNAQAHAFENILNLYQGELLEGFYYDWALQERERLRCLYLDAQAHLMAYYKQHHAYEAGLVCGRKILYHDPLREEVYREMIRLYLASGQRPLAIRQYQICQEVLHKELGIPPMEETQALYTQIVNDVTSREVQSLPFQGADHLSEAAHSLELGMQALEAAHEHFQFAAQVIENLSEVRNQISSASRSEHK
jgi:DNA-binding SARP family transcriptional activator